MNYGQYETERRLKSLSSKTGKYTSKLVFNIFKAFFILFLFLAVAGAAVGFGMIKGIIDNAQALCKGLLSRDIKIVSGGTDNHLMLVDLTNYDLTGKAVEKLLDAVNITCNKNTIPNDPKSPFVTSGVRLGTAAVTSRGMNTEDMDKIAEAIAMMIKEGEAASEKARAIVAELTAKYPLKIYFIIFYIFYCFPLIYLL